MTKIYLAPMAGITDVAMRALCVEQGAQLAFSEMVSAKGIQYRNKRTRQLLAVGDNEKQIGVQLFGHEPAVLADTARWVEEALAERLAVLDINMGCPAPKIVNNGDGCALMKDELHAARVIEAVKRAVHTPVSVKFRKGFDEEHINAVAFARMAQDAGADLVTVHGRTRSQFYSGKADWDILAQVKQAVRIPVVGNGDVFAAEDARDLLERTGCDGVMVARGAMGNPFLFAQIRELLEEGSVRTKPSVQERVQTCLRQARLMIEQKGEKLAIMQMRTHAAHYIKGMHDAARLRAQVVRVSSYAQLEQNLTAWTQAES